MLFFSTVLESWNCNATQYLMKMTVSQASVTWLSELKNITTISLIFTLSLSSITPSISSLQTLSEDFVLLQQDQIVTTQTQSQLNSTKHKKSCVWHENYFTPPPPQTQCKQYLSCSWPNFYQTLKVGFWDQQPYYWPDFN